MKNKKDIITTVITVTVFVFVIGICLFSIVFREYQEHNAESQFQTLSEMVTQNVEDTTEKHTIPIVCSENIEKSGNRSINTLSYEMQSEYHSIPELISMNKDCIGWVSIPNTSVNYPVMHTPDNSDKYLNLDYFEEYSIYGTPFLDSRCNTSSSNLIIYGHHMNNGSMFADLCKYENRSYRDSHPTVYFETADDISAYTVFAVLKVNADDDWYRFTDVTTEKRFNEKTSYAEKNSIFNTNITPEYPQQILSLSTCYGTDKNQRILVLAVKN